MRSLFEGGTSLSNYCNLQLKSLLHLGQMLLHLGLHYMKGRLLHLGLRLSLCSR